jgi:hypothetical protein
VCNIGENNIEHPKVQGRIAYIRVRLENGAINMEKWHSFSQRVIAQ